MYLRDTDRSRHKDLDARGDAFESGNLRGERAFSPDFRRNQFRSRASPWARVCATVREDHPTRTLRSRVFNAFVALSPLGGISYASTRTHATRARTTSRASVGHPKDKINNRSAAPKTSLPRARSYAP